MLAYLVIREGSKWTDVFRLVPGETITIGRAPTNQIVINDDRCSRRHAEVFLSQGAWILRDLDSRNGTGVDDVRIEGDHQLRPGEVVRIGRSQLAFVDDLSQAFAEMSSSGKLTPQLGNDKSSSSLDVEDDHVLTAAEPTTITHRRGQTRYLDAPDDDGAIPKAGRAAAKLCHLGFELTKLAEPEPMSKQALASVFESTQIDSGAVLLFPEGSPDNLPPSELKTVASRSDSEIPYHRISPFLAATVLREKEAVLARNVMGDSAVSSRDSKGEIHATSVICAPVGRSGQVFGLLHLYSTQTDREPDPDDLEFALAVADTLAAALYNLSRRQELSNDLKQARGENEELRQRLEVHSEIVGNSNVIKQITEQIGRAAPSKATVLIRGESGVGKELVARAVHFSSPRRKKPFVCLNCAALTETLLESELFGHEKGAFTGATERKFGKFEAANGGTLMLDEIGEMSPTIQAKFLRVLEGHPFERVGGSQPVKVDVRVIAATNRDLEKEVSNSRFRRDLYFRLNVVEIIVPGLRKRPEDIPELAQYFLERLRGETGRKIRGFTSKAIEQMLRYRWPGNVRELKNVIERATLLAEGDYIDAGDLMLSKLATAGDTGEMTASEVNEFKAMSLADVERRHIQATLDATSWNKSQAASILGIERSTLDRKIRRYNLRSQVRSG